MFDYDCKYRNKKMRPKNINLKCFFKLLSQPTNPKFQLNLNDTSK